MLFDKITILIVLDKILDFTSQLNTIIIVVDELHKDVFNVRFEEFQVGEDGLEGVNFFLESAPNQFFLARVLFELLFAEDGNVGDGFDKLIFTLICLFNFTQ